MLSQTTAPEPAADGMPGRFPAAAIDKIISAGQDVGIADFMLQLELHFAHRLDPERLGRALQLLLDAEPVLGCRLVTEKSRVYWERLEGRTPGPLSCPATQAEAEAFRDKPIDSRRGPQLAACLDSSADGDRLLLKVSHQACDAGGLNDLAAQLSHIYARLGANSDFRPRPNLGGCRDCSQIMRQLPWYIHPALAVLFARTTLSTQVPKRTHALHVPLAPPHQPFTFVVKHIAPDRFERLRAFGRQHRATVNDLMIAAFYLALLKKEPWDSRAALRIQTTVDLRRHYLPAGKAGGVCNLSTYEHICLGASPGKDFGAILDRVAALTRRKKAGWIGLGELCAVPLAGCAPYGLLVKACGWLLRDRVESRNYPSGLTNLGRISPEGVDFDGPPAAAWVLPPVVFPPVLYLGFSGYRNSLTLSGGVPLAARECITDFFSTMLEALPA